MATLKIRLKSRKMAPSNRVRLDVRRLRDEGVAQQYERELAESLGEPNDSDDPEKLWTDLKTKVLKVSESSLRDACGTSKSFSTEETLNTIAGSRRDRNEGRTGQHRELKREAVSAVRRDKDAQVRGVCETGEYHLWSTEYRHAYRGIRTLCCSRPPLCFSTAKAADGTTLTGKSEIRARWAGYFEELYRVDHPIVSFPRMLTLSGMRTPL